MRPDMGSSAIVLFLIAAIVATVFFTARGIVRYMRKREADRREILDLMREQYRRDNE